MIQSERKIDLICMGRVAVDFYADQIHSPLEHAQSFSRYLGGCAGNISVGTSRLGLKSAMFSCVGTDDMGVFLRNQLQFEGVDTSLLRSTPDHLTGLVVLGVSPPDRFPLIFYRENCADMQIRPQDADPDFFQRTPGRSAVENLWPTHHIGTTAKGIRHNKTRRPDHYK